LPADRHKSCDSVPFTPDVAILTGGGDRPYALGLAACLLAQGVTFDFVGSDELKAPALFDAHGVRFLNLRGNQDPDAPVTAKVVRVARYYARLLAYAWRSQAPIFHLLWNNKLEYLDRTALLLWYRCLGKRLAYTVHNVNVRKRDGRDSALNRLTLRLQYRIVDQLFVHTDDMKQELQAEFDVPSEKISVIPFGLNSTVPNTDLTGAEARARLGLAGEDKVVLFFGNIAPYKGVEYLVEAMAIVAAKQAGYRFIIAGRPKGSESYWPGVRDRIAQLGLDAIATLSIQYIRDEDTEVFFKAADVFVIPYTQIFQSGVLFLGYNFGLPVIASDVASLRQDIAEGRTGFLCAPKDERALADAIERYFASPLYRELASRRDDISQLARERHSWDTVGNITARVYRACSPRTQADRHVDEHASSPETR
jgi:glycosyltransferase involved in cell wall biosynthesis